MANSYLMITTNLQKNCHKTDCRSDVDEYFAGPTCTCILPDMPGRSDVIGTDCNYVVKFILYNIGIKGLLVDSSSSSSSFSSSSSPPHPPPPVHYRYRFLSLPTYSTLLPLLFPSYSSSMPPLLKEEGGDVGKTNNKKSRSTWHAIWSYHIVMTHNVQEHVYLNCNEGTAPSHIAYI